jgi:hypothetical protein
VYGRFAIVAGQSPAQTAALCRLQTTLLWRRRASWATRKSARRVFGPLYAHTREAVLTRKARSA